MRLLPLLAMLLALALACGDDDAGDDAGADAGADVGGDVGSDATVDAGPMLDPWPGRMPATSELGLRRGRAIARSIIHLHSPLSHDACDGEGWVDGELADPDCLQHLRDSLCALRIDAAMLTDHAPHVNEADFMRALWIADGDEPILVDDVPVANRMACADGHRVLIQVGSENRLMPIGLERHPGDSTDPEVLNTLYDSDDVDAIAAFRDAGALVWIAHTEEKDVDYLRGLNLDGLELYNLHADVDPRSRQEFLGIEDPGGFLGTLLGFTRPALDLTGDLAVMTFLSRQAVTLGKWDTLLAEGRRIAGSGGCDAHENAFPMPLLDGERADSYRRMMSWITNHVLVDEVSPEGIQEGLDTGRLYVVHEVFGTPMGFDFVATDGTDEYDMGDAAPLGVMIEASMPALPEGFPNDPAPTLSLHLLRSEAGGAVEVASTTEATLSFAADQPGAYRVEVRMVPEHARPYVAAVADELIREQTWVYSNPIFVELPEPAAAPPIFSPTHTSPAWQRVIRRAQQSIPVRAADRMPGAPPPR